MNIAIIMAGGTGSRMKLSYPKQFAKINGLPMVAYSLKQFEKHEEIKQIYVVCGIEWRDELGKIIKDNCIEKFCGFILPGETRRESSKNAVDFVYEKVGAGKVEAGNVVLIHDAARPGITKEIIDDNLLMVKETGACCTVVKCRDSMCRLTGNTLGETVERNDTVLLQTPQTFYISIIKKAHDNYCKLLEKGEKLPEITDDTGLVRLMGISVVSAKGSFSNMKVTEPGDIELFSGKMSQI